MLSRSSEVLEKVARRMLASYWRNIGGRIEHGADWQSLPGGLLGSRLRPMLYCELMLRAWGIGTYVAGERDSLWQTSMIQEDSYK